MPEEDEEKRQSLLDRFFELIGEEYDSLIDIRRNLANIQNLLELLRRLSEPIEGLTIIDYGCGTGLSLQVASRYRVSVIGVERCPMMRAMSIARGMIVWSESDLARQPSNSLSAVFASYVFHLQPHRRGLRLLWSRLKPHGALLANFHKGAGIATTNSCLTEEGCRILNLDAPDGSSLHGPYVAYVKET